MNVEWFFYSVREIFSSNENYKFYKISQEQCRRPQAMINLRGNRDQPGQQIIFI